MASCEKCWEESLGDAKRYIEMLRNRTCTPEQQAGRDASLCHFCWRMTVHQHAHICMFCGHKERERKKS